MIRSPEVIEEYRAFKEAKLKENPDWCPFCDESSHTKLVETQNFFVTENKFHYLGLKEHFLICTKIHKPDITPEEEEELKTIVKIFEVTNFYCARNFTFQSSIPKHYHAQAMRWI